MDAIISRLLSIEKTYGTEIFFDKPRATALIKDFFAESKRDRKLLEKGLELNIYKKFINSIPTDILILKTRLTKELCDEHGLSDEAAEQTVNIWIRLIEAKRQLKILEPDKVERKKALDAYKKNLEKPDVPADRSAAVYASTDNGPRRFRISKTQPYLLKKADQTFEDQAASMPTPYESTEVPPIQNIMGNLFFQSDDFDEAFKWFEKAALQGDAIAQNNLAYCYLYGKGVEKNTAAAIDWFTNAARSGDAMAALSLANCYYDGVGVKRDIEKAIPLYMRSAEDGNMDAQFILGECYSRGDGIKKSKVNAVKWFERAANQGHQEAAERLQDLRYFKTMMHLRHEADETVPHKGTELNAKLFADRLVTGIKDNEFLSHIVTPSESFNLTSLIKNRLKGLGIRLDSNEYPVFLYNDATGGMLSLSDTALFTTKGVYIHYSLRRSKFMYYADINSIEIDHNGLNRIWLNKYFVNCEALKYGEIHHLMRMIQITAKEFR